MSELIGKMDGKKSSTLPGKKTRSSSPPVKQRPRTADGFGDRPVDVLLSAEGAMYSNERLLSRESERERAEGLDSGEEARSPDRLTDRGEEAFDPTDDNNLFYQSSPSLKRPNSKQHKRKTNPNSGFFHPPKPKSDEFRREYSKDHPLAGGKGKYDKERTGGEKHPVGLIDNEPPKEEKNLLKNAGVPQYDKVVHHKASSLPGEKNQIRDVASWQNEIDTLRRQQNQALLALLEEERLCEEDRTKMGKLVRDHDERHKLELVFSEERKRASERIISMTRMHEINLKDATARVS